MKIAASISRRSGAIWGRKPIVGQHIALEVHAGRDLDQLKALFAEAQHAALGDVEHGLARRAGPLAAESHMFHFVDELRHRAVAANAQPAVADVDLGAGGERPDEKHVARSLADIDEPAGAGEPPTEAADVDVPVAVDLRYAKECLIQSRAVVEVELVGLINDCLRVGGRAEAQAAGGHAADRARLDGERDQVENPFLAGHRWQCPRGSQSQGSRPN